MIARVHNNELESLTPSLIGNSPVGTIISYAGDNVPNGYLLCNGNTFDATTYPDLYNVLKSNTLPTITNSTTLGYQVIKALHITASSVGSAAEVVTVPRIDVGTVVAFAGNTVPEHYLPCDGSEFDTETYSELYNILGSNKLPDYRGRFLEGVPNGETVGTTKAAGLPNIEGSVGILKDVNAGSWYEGINMSSGAFSSSYRQNINLNPVSAQSSGTSGLANYIVFRASDSNSIYGNSDTVQPPAVTVNYIIRSDNFDMTDLVEQVSTNTEAINLPLPTFTVTGETSSTLNVTSNMSNRPILAGTCVQVILNAGTGLRSSWWIPLTTPVNGITHLQNLGTAKEGPCSLIAAVRNTSTPISGQHGWFLDIAE